MAGGVLKKWAVHVKKIRGKAYAGKNGPVD